MSESFADKLAKQANQLAADAAKKAKDAAEEREKAQQVLRAGDLVALRSAIAKCISDYQKSLRDALDEHWEDPATKRKTEFFIFTQFIGEFSVIKIELAPLLNDLVTNGLKPLIFIGNNSKVHDHNWSTIGTQSSAPMRPAVDDTGKFITIKLGTDPQNISGWQDLSGWSEPKTHQCKYGTDRVSVGVQFLNLR